MFSRPDSRRLWLVATVIILAMGDTYILSQHRVRDDARSWTIWMPQLEREQTRHPENLLVSSEARDSRYPIAASIDPQFDAVRPSMLRDLLSCRPTALLIVDAVGEPQLPRRFYVYSTALGFAQCVGGRLPTGYVLTAGEVSVPKSRA